MNRSAPYPGAELIYANRQFICFAFYITVSDLNVSSTYVNPAGYKLPSDTQNVEKLYRYNTNNDYFIYLITSISNCN